MRKMESSPSDSRLFRLTLIGFLLLSLIDSLNPVHGFLFGSAGGGGCSCPQPVCQPSLPPPTCCSAPVQSCGSSSSNGVGAIIVNCNGGSSGSGCGGGGGGGGCGGGCSSGGGGGGCSGGGGGGCLGGGGGGGCSGGGGGGSECAGGCSAVVESQYASAGSGGGGGYASQPISNGYAQSKGTGYAQPSVGGYAQQGYAQQGNNDKGYQSASEGGYSQQQQQQGGGGYRAQQGPAPVQPPPSYQSQAQPEPQPEPQPAAPEPSHQEVQPAANEAENYSGGSETEAGVAAAAGDRLQEVQEEDAVVERINTETTDLKKTTLPFTTTSTATITASIQIQKGIGGEQHSDVFIEPIDISQLKLTNDTECNSEELRTIIIENLLADDLNLAKRTIQLQAETRFGGRFDVVCSHHDFSYITNTELWCQETRDNTSCYAYRQLGY